MEDKVNTNLYSIRKRSDFILASRSKKTSSASINLQARQRAEDEFLDKYAIRVGITCTKKIGNAVTRNRAKRRLRELSRKIIPFYGTPGWDYVLIGKPLKTSDTSFKLLSQDLRYAIKKIHGNNIV